MKKWNRRMSFLGIGLMVGSIVLPTLQVWAEGTDETSTTLGENSSTNSPYEVEPYTKEALAAYETAHQLILQAKKTKTIADIRKAYESFVLLTPHLNVQNFDAYAPQDQMDEIFYEVHDLLYEFTPEKQRESEIVRFAQKWHEILMKNYNSIYVHHFRYFVIKNQLTNIQDKLEELLVELNRYANGVPSPDGIIPLPTEEEMQELIDEFFKEYGPDKPEPTAPTEEEIDNQIGNQYPQHNGNDITTEQIRYEKIGKDWYEITETIRGGKVIKTVKRKLSANEAYFLIVRDNPNYDPYSPLEPVEYISEREWDYLTTNQNEESRYTIHYTVNKDEETPYYYDTGIRVNNQKEATYEQYKDVLLILADKANGYFVEDKTKTLIVLEGKPIVVIDNQETYSKQELESLFSEFDKVEIRIMETKIGQAGSLEEQIISKQAKTVMVDGEEISLETFPMVKNERALLPLHEIAIALGGKVTQEEDSFIVTKEKTSVRYRLKDSSVYVNGKRITLKNTPTLKDGIVMVETIELATALGYRMTWDGETSTLVFEKR